MFSNYKNNSNTKEYVISIGIGVILLVWSGVSLIKTEEAKTWPSIKGRVVTSEINTSQARSISYEANIHFMYVINGQNYISDKVSFGEFRLTHPSYAQTIVKKYPLNKEVTIYYNPKNPREAILDFNEASMFFYLTIGFLFLLAGLLIKFKIIKIWN